LGYLIRLTASSLLAICGCDDIVFLSWIIACRALGLIQVVSFVSLCSLFGLSFTHVCIDITYIWFDVYGLNTHGLVAFFLASHTLSSDGFVLI